MIDEKIIEYLKNLNGEYDFIKLIEYMQASGFCYKQESLRGPIAIATLTGVLVDLDNCDSYNDKMVYFIFLHETAHMKRITKLGKEKILSNLSITDFQEFIDHIFVEEILADRFACRMFYKFNKEIYPWYQTQMLNEPSKQEKYKPMANLYFNKIDNNEENYNELIKQFIY
jgi:hypothetical protein